MVPAEPRSSLIDRLLSWLLSLFVSRCPRAVPPDKPTPPPTTFAPPGRIRIAEPDTPDRMTGDHLL